MGGRLALTLGWLALAGCLEPPQSGDADGSAGDAARELPPGPTDGLVAYWSMDSIELGLVRDAVGGHDATCIRCPVPNVGHVGDGALLFRGGAENDYLTVDWPDLTPASGTVSAWIYIEGATDTVIISRPYQGDSSLLDSFLLGTFSYGAVFLEYPNGYDESTTFLDESAWNHVAGTWSPDERAVYVNGSVQHFPGREIPYDDTLLYIGSDYDEGMDLYHWAGAIDDLRVYDRALDDFEIGQILGL